MHDPDHEHEIDAALEAMRFEKTESTTGTRWQIQPTRLTCGDACVGSAALIMAECYNGPGEIAAYEPVGIGYHLDETLLLIAEDYRRRRPENNDFCPEGYAIYNRDAYGRYRRDAEITKA
jgi:hypothetical protein